MTTFQKSVLGAGCLAAVILLLGWTLPEPGGSSTGVKEKQPGMACTEIGCESALYADLSQIRVAFPGIRRLKICIDGKCRVLGNRNLDQSFRVIRTKLGAGRHTVKFVARGGRGQILGHGSRRAKARRWQPNGRGCPPVCFEVMVRVDMNGRLVPIRGIA